MLNKAEINKKILPVIEKAVEINGLKLVEANFTKEAGKWMLKIFIYNPGAPVTLEDCENITKNLNDYPDELIPVSYNLEVSSPGINRKFKSEKEYDIFKGKKAKVKMKNGEVFITEVNDELKEKYINKEISYTRLEPEYKFKGDKK